MLMKRILPKEAAAFLESRFLGGNLEVPKRPNSPDSEAVIEQLGRPITRLINVGILLIRRPPYIDSLLVGQEDSVPM